MKIRHFTLIAFLLVMTVACREDSIDTDDDKNNEEETYSDWTDATHSKSADLDYSTVFNQNKVLRFDIKIDSDKWESMQADLATNLGNSGGRPVQGMGPGDGPGPGEETSSDFDPIWVDCSFNFNDTEWYHVGIRYKGNSSLSTAYQSGNKKMSFKLDFDEFEDDYPELKNQRFYGFKQLNLNSNFNDPSLMREKVGADLFRQFGLASANTTFCLVYVDNGSGSQYYGVYTIVEEVDDTVLDEQFNDGSGNLYKPDGAAASFAAGTYDEDQMEKKSNEDEADFTDVNSLYTIINSSDRTVDNAKWKTDLEAALNVDGFLKWLAANTVIQNWDTYGNMTHNYFLYNNPETSKLNWIPWDNNEAFQYGKMEGAISLSLSDVDSQWPLIKYLADDSDYKKVYEDYLLEFINDVFIPADLNTAYSKYYDMLKEYADAEEDGYSYIHSDFDQSVATLKAHVQERNDAVTNYLK